MIGIGSGSMVGISLSGLGFRCEFRHLMEHGRALSSYMALYDVFAALVGTSACLIRSSGIRTVHTPLDLHRHRQCYR